MMDSLKQKFREFRLTSLAVDNGTSIFILVLMILIFGLRAYRTMPKESYPDASMPTVFVNTPYFGNSPSDIESLVSRPLEKELSTISGLNKLNSSSFQDFSVIKMEFDADLEQETVLRKVKDAVDLAKSELPDDIDQDPIVEEVNYAEFPIMTINLSGNFSMDDLRNHAEYLQDKVESLREINEVTMKGALDREVKIDIDLIKMQSLMVSFIDVESAIAQENLSMSAGEIVRNDFRRSIRVIGEFQSTEEIENVIIKSENEKPIYLKDFATVTYGFEERTSYARSNGLPVISLDVIKRRGANIIFASQKIQDLIEEEEKILPPSLKITIFNDSSRYTKESIATLENSIISGVILVVLVLLFFLGLRNALFVGIAIPLSMLMAIMFLNMSGTTLNIVVLFALILALGLLVDNAIVVVENIYRHMQEGHKAVVAAKNGASEVAMPIIASTATTLAAFLPLAFWPGIMGQFMKYMPITLISVLLSSLFVALVVNPVFTSRLMTVSPDGASNNFSKRRNNVLIGALFFFFGALASHLVQIFWLRNVFSIVLVVSLINFFVFRRGTVHFQNVLMPWLEKHYRRFVEGVLSRFWPITVFLGTIFMLYGAAMILQANQPKVEYFPSADPIYINTFVDLPLGSDIEATNEVVRNIEQDIGRAIQPYISIVEEVLTQIGEDTSDPNTPPEPGVTPHRARISVSFVPFAERNGASTRDVMEAIRKAVSKYAGVRLVIDKNADGPPTGLPISIELVGEDIDDLTQLSERLIVHLNDQNIPGIEELKSDVVLARPELIVNIDREAARRYGVSTAQISSTIRTAVFGKEVSKFKVGEDEYPIMIRLDEPYRFNIDDLMNQKITFRDQARRGEIVQVPISSVAGFTYKTSYNTIQRKDQKRVVTIYSNVISGFNGNEINEELKAVMARYSLPNGVTYEFTGEQEQQAEDRAFLNSAFLVAIFAIFIIIVAQFNSLYSPFIIVLSVLFSTIGVFLGYTISDMTISVVFTGVGIISLAGIVVNNAIVLIDYIDLLIKRKRDEKGYESMLEMSADDIRAAIVQGGATRLRPVLLTAITTVLGLVPLAIGINIDFLGIVTDLDPNIYFGGDTTSMWAPLAWTVIFGLIFATFLTLVVVPVMYWLAYKLKYNTEGRFYRKRNLSTSGT